MKLITEEVARVKFIVEGKGAQKKMYIEVYSFKVKLKTVMVECIQLTLLQKRLIDIMKVSLKKEEH